MFLPATYLFLFSTVIRFVFELLSSKSVNQFNIVTIDLRKFIILFIY